MIDFKNEFGGEMTPIEREKLYTWVLELQPKKVLETGAGNGGGSTYYIASALPKSSVLYTCDPTRTPPSNFFTEFPNVHYRNCKSHEMIIDIIGCHINIDFIFFDGPEDPNIALDDIKKLEISIKEGTKFSMHDWAIEKRIYDNNISTKAKKIRPYMESSKQWKLIEELPNSKESVGLCLYEFEGNN